MATWNIFEHISTADIRMTLYNFKQYRFATLNKSHTHTFGFRGHILMSVFLLSFHTITAQYFYYYVDCWLILDLSTNSFDLITSIFAVLNYFISWSRRLIIILCIFGGILFAQREHFDTQPTIWQWKFSRYSSSVIFLTEHENSLAPQKRWILKQYWIHIF